MSAIKLKLNASRPFIKAEANCRKRKAMNEDKNYYMAKKKKRKKNVPAAKLVTIKAFLG